jgi:hypothetical protein
MLGCTDNDIFSDVNTVPISNDGIKIHFDGIPQGAT